jgi:hypothetical protein
VQPEPEIKSCISRSLQATPKEVLNGPHKVTQQDPTSLVIATRKQIIDQNRQYEYRRNKRDVSQDISIEDEARMRKPRMMNVASMNHNKS